MASAPPGTYDFATYWSERFAHVQRPQGAARNGWTASSDLNEGFVEPTLREQFEGDPRVILISAPGAVGKSMYAQELAAKFGLAMLDLSQAGPVGQSTLIGSAFQFLGSEGPAKLKGGNVGIGVG